MARTYKNNNGRDKEAKRFDRDSKKVEKKRRNAFRTNDFFKIEQIEMEENVFAPNTAIDNSDIVEGEDTDYLSLIQYEKEHRNQEEHEYDDEFFNKMEVDKLKED